MTTTTREQRCSRSRTACAWQARGGAGGRHDPDARQRRYGGGHAVGIERVENGYIVRGSAVTPPPGMGIDDLEHPQMYRQPATFIAATWSDAVGHAARSLEVRELEPVNADVSRIVLENIDVHTIQIGGLSDAQLAAIVDVVDAERARRARSA